MVTKFDIGEIVWFSNNGMIQCGNVAEVKITRRDIFYHIVDEHDDDLQFEQTFIFKTEKEARQAHIETVLEIVKGQIEKFNRNFKKNEFPYEVKLINLMEEN